MITLGLRDIILKRQNPSSRGVRSFSETIKGLNPSPAVLQALSETIEWCSSSSAERSRLRSPELDPSMALKIPQFKEQGMEIWLERKRESYRVAVDAINAKRSILTREAGITMSGSAIQELRGRLLLYEVLETVTDGASEASSRCFFDIEDAPPWDTWFRYSDGSILSWVPESMVQYAQAGIDANPVDCIHWCDRRRKL